MIDQLFANILDAATVAAGTVIRTRTQGQQAINLDVFALVAKPIYTAAIDTLPAEWAKVVQANVSDATLSIYVKAQAAELGLKVADAYFAELAWHC